MKDKLLAATAYIFGIPSLYIVLTGKRYKNFIGYHGCQALLLWSGIFAVFFLVRFLINLSWRFYYWPSLGVLEVLTGTVLWAYALFCGIRLLLGIEFRIPR